MSSSEIPRQNPLPAGLPLISVVVPVYKEEENIAPFLRRIVPVLERIGSYEILFCLDPSPDRTEEVIAAEIARNPNIGLIVFSRRFGQPSAVMAGIHNCRGETCVVIDVDLQDPPELIGSLHAKLVEGYDVVYARRRSRRGETLLKKLVSQVGYKFLNELTEVEIPRDTGDFRIMSGRVIDHLRALKEGHGFLRGLVAFVGFRQIALDYDRDERMHGRSHYNRYIGSLKIAFNGLVGFSNFLLTATMLLGLIIAIISFFFACFVVIAKTCFHQHFELGIPTIIILVLFMGAIQLIGIGVLGQYIGRIYDEVKHRPPYIIDRSINTASEASNARSPAGVRAAEMREDVTLTRKL
jgi:polyisoprenyl-phosphate glycosyltransferase